MKGLRTLVAVAALAGLLTAPTAAKAEYLEDAGWGSLTMLANVVYMPAKFIYATVGGLTGGLAYACTAGRLDTAESIWSTSLGGTYVLTPSMLRGDQGVAFAALGSPKRTAVAKNTSDPLGWPGVEVQDDDLAGTTFGRTDQKAAQTGQGVGGF